ncbi:NACHT domain-containing protein [Streptomyces sp. NPDC002888]|uniref:NACHT domain-containing protein n=1 Tax=Streptomyces sp. NPDC002888 TaxID=3364668 RepID=UPI00368ED302
MAPLPAWAAAGHHLALDDASVVTAAGGVVVALIAGAVALWQTRRTRRLELDKMQLEKEKIQLQLSADSRLKEQEWAHEQRVSERERRREAEDAERERSQVTEELAARRSGLVVEAAAYCARLVQELSTLRILDMSRPLRLDSLYVQVRVQEQQPLRFVREEELAQERAQDDTRREASPDTATAAHTYAPVDALQRYQRIVVVGDPGAGKTTMLRHLALRMARRTEGETLPELPAYVELFRFVESGHDSLLDYLAEYWTDQYGFADARDYVAEKLTDGTAALLLDGLDEVLGGESAEVAAGAYHRVTEEIARLATRFPRALIATTCRRHGWQGGLQQFQVLEALDFEWPQIETFIANWFGDRDRRRRGLVRALSANARLQTLATNPLLLSLIAIVYERDLELPERRAALYRRCVEVLLREWDAHRKVTRYSRFTTDRKQDLLKQIAWHYHQRGRRYFREDELLELIADFLPTIDLPRTDSRAILDEIAAQYGLLKAQAHGWYGFLHLTLQEHFAATALLEQGESGIERAVAARYDPWWEEVILLLAGALPDATGLLLGVLQVGAGERRTREDDPALLHLPHDDLFHTDLLLAARCLTGSPRVADVELRRQIIRSVWELLETTPYEGERQRAAQAIVGVLGSEQQLSKAIAWIGDNRQNTAAREALVDALAVHGGRSVGERLLGVLTLESGLPASLRGHLMKALGTLHVEAAVPKLLDELAEVVNLPKPVTSGGQYEVADHVGTVVRALGAAGGPVEVIVGTIHAFTFWQSRGRVMRAIRDALADVRDPSTGELLLNLLVQENDWYFERQTLAGAYLDVAGEYGAGVLLDIVRSDRTTEFQKIPMMAALAEFTGKGHGWAHRDALLALARETAAAWQLRWLALECLDHNPGDPKDLEPLVHDANPQVCVAAAATSAAWGAPLRLDFIQRAILDGVISPDLTYTERGGRAWGWTGRAARRLGAALAPYGDIGVAQHFFYRAASDSDDSMSNSARSWLDAFAPEAAVDAYLIHLSGSGHSGDLPSRVPHSRIRAVLHHCRDNPVSLATGHVHDLLVRSVAKVADDGECVAGLLALVARGPGTTSSRDVAHGAAYEVSRRAHVRVLSDHTIVAVT